MKFKIWAITSAFCLVPILFGVILWDRLPDIMAIHFDINNNPDNFASKSFVVFWLPFLMMLLQTINCAITDFNSKKHGERKKFEKIIKWIIPALCIILQAVTLAYALEVKLDIRKIVCVLVGLMLIVIGNYLPKFDYIKNYDVDTEKARKVNRFIGFLTVIMGLLFAASIFFAPIASMTVIFLLIPYAIISATYAVVVVRKK